jgi:hypothetical protein
MKRLTIYLFFIITGCFFVSCKKETKNEVSADFRDKYIGKFKGIRTTNDGLIDSNYVVEFSKLDQIPSHSIIDSRGEKYSLFELDGIVRCRGFDRDTYFYKDSVIKRLDIYSTHGAQHFIEIWRLYKIN